MSEMKVEVKGIRDLRKGLKQIEDDLPKELRDGLAEVSEFVVGIAREKVPRRSGDAADSMKVRKQSAAAAIAVGGSAAPYYPWLDFGGSVGRGRAGKGTGSVKRPFLKEGRYIYPTLKEKRSVINEKVDKLIGELAVKAGFETSGKAND